MTLSIESLQSDAVAHKFLVRMHESAAPNPAALYRVAAKVGACARQASAFETTSDGTELAMRPLLEYYAMLHWIKVLLHLCILDYPPSSAVLQHGMSSRRIKRENYRWPLESVYLYKQGVLQSFYALTWATERDRKALERDQRSQTGAKEKPGAKENSDAEQKPGAEGKLDALGAPSAQEGRSGERVLTGAGASLVEPPLLPAKLVIGTLLGAIPVMHDALSLFYPQFTDAASEARMKAASSTAAAPITALTTDAGTAFPTSEWFPRFVLLFSLSGLVRYNPVEWSDILVWSNESDAYLIREFLSQPRFRFQLSDFVRM